MNDDSPREAWARITDERIMRRELARELNHLSNHVYSVDQESVTADEKETDIRLRATRSDQQAVIELKIGEKTRSAAALRSAIGDQLVRKYLAPPNCRAGCLLITVGSNKAWLHPESGEKLDFSGLIRFLSDEADQLSARLAGSVRLLVRGLDLRARLAPERQQASGKTAGIGKNAKTKRSRGRKTV